MLKDLMVYLKLNIFLPRKGGSAAPSVQVLGLALGEQRGACRKMEAVLSAGFNQTALVLMMPLSLPKQLPVLQHSSYLCHV